jgi:hypothetical protein
MQVSCLASSGEVSFRLVKNFLPCSDDRNFHRKLDNFRSHRFSYILDPSDLRGRSGVMPRHVFEKCLQKPWLMLSVSLLLKTWMDLK